MDDREGRQILSGEESKAYESRRRQGNQKMTESGNRYAARKIERWGCMTRGVRRCDGGNELRRLSSDLPPSGRRSPEEGL